MPEYAYVAQTSRGAIENGRICDSDPASARQNLAQRGRRLVSIQESAKPAWISREIAGLFGRYRYLAIRQGDAELMLQQLAVMLASGLELTPSLRELSLYSTKRSQQLLCHELAEVVEQGQAFATALSETRSFPAVVSQLVRVGEETGELSTSLQRASEFMESRRRLWNNLIAALAYPLLVAIAACSVATYLVGWAIPKLAVFLLAMGRKLPTMTQSLLDVADLLQVYGPQWVVLLVASGVASGLTYAWRPGRYQVDKALLFLPIVGNLVRMAETHQLASSMSLMLRSGVFLPDALNTAARLHHNRYLSEQVVDSRRRVAMGQDFAGSLRDSGFCPMLSSMIAVGERTGDLAKALEHVSKFYAVQIESKLKRIGTLIEPVIIVVVGGFVGYVYIAFFMALLSAGGNFK